MANHLGVPSYSVEEVARLRLNGRAPILLDVREANELALANLGHGVIHVPLSELAAKGLPALPQEMTHYPDVEIVVFCHHGVRSTQVTGWLRANGFPNAINMDGGIDAYATRIDPSIGHY